MSEFINNSDHKKDALKAIIKRLHEGESVDAVRAAFEALTVNVSATEITEIEQALVDEGLAVSEIQKLCDVHASVFKGSIEDIHREDGFDPQDFDLGHPLHTFKLENRRLEQLMDHDLLGALSAYSEHTSTERKQALINIILKLETIDKHYKRKENLIFPYMEKYNITAPPQVMWGVDDEIRLKIKVVKSLLSQEKVEVLQLNQMVNDVVHQINEMIFKEEEIMFPMILEKFSQREWIEIEAASAEIGYTLLNSVNRWRPKLVEEIGEVNSVGEPARPSQILEQPEVTHEVPASVSLQDIIVNRIQKDAHTYVPMDAGGLSAKEINAILNTVPFDMTFVDANNQVKYFTQGKERIFDRPVTIIGREVKHCHPPKSVHIVEQIVDDLRSGKKDNEDFWIKLGDQFVYIRYFAVRDKEGQFLGTLEITQNIKPITELEGEKRLMS